jgi:hypothetical protein
MGNIQPANDTTSPSRSHRDGYKLNIKPRVMMMTANILLKAPFAYYYGMSELNLCDAIFSSDTHTPISLDDDF